ncbi:MAG: IucA/IucC family siderophore biosynthesis protein [Myxococcota bacterium]
MSRLDGWSQANQRLAAKMLAELAHECVIRPTRSRGSYRVVCNGVSYRFEADRLPLDHWRIREGSVVEEDTEQQVTDTASLFLNVAVELGVPAGVLESYLEEVIATASTLAYHFDHQRHDASSLARADFQVVEASMSEGHPCFIANSGRIGFSQDDRLVYAPECGSEFAVIWLAGLRDRTIFACVDGLSYETLLAEELGAEKLAAFNARLRERGLDPSNYRFLPIHPWQWANKIATSFADEIASDHLVFLGPSSDLYQPQQSVRTLFNRSSPRRHYVKTALSILNMGFVRGLSPTYMESTPAINQWLHQTLSGDPEFARFTVLREVAATGYRHPHFERAAPKSSAKRKMFAALWRESPVAHAAPSSRLATMAALVHRDRSGRALLPALVEESGLTPEAWLERYLSVYLRPILHCFFAHELVFMPHGENLIFELERGIPIRAFIKDIGEEVLLFDTDRKLPEKVARIALEVDDTVRTSHILADVFDSFLRFLADVFDREQQLTAEHFWQTVRECVQRYQADHPELDSRFARFDLFVPSFERLCLNRMQLKNNVQMLNLADPVASFQFADALDNPIADVAEPVQRGVQ